MPGPSWRPFLGAFGVFALFLGLVFGGWLLAVGVIALITTLIGWLTDAVMDYRRGRRGGHDRPPRQRPAPGDAATAVHGPGRPDRRRGGPPVGLFTTARRPVPAGRPRPARRVRRRSGVGPAGVRPAASGARGRRRCRPTSRSSPGHRIRRDDVHGTGRQAVHARVRQRGRRDAPQRRAQGRVGRQSRLQGRDLQRRRDAGLRRPGAAGRHATRTSAASTRT